MYNRKFYSRQERLDYWKRKAQEAADYITYCEDRIRALQSEEDDKTFKRVAKEISREKYKKIRF